MCPYDCIRKPCCMRSNPEDFRQWVEDAYRCANLKNAFDIVYHSETLGRMNTVPIVGDTVFGYTVWRVDYKERVVYVTK